MSLVKSIRARRASAAYMRSEYTDFQSFLSLDFASVTFLVMVPKVFVNYGSFTAAVVGELIVEVSR